MAQRAATGMDTNHAQALVFINSSGDPNAQFIYTGKDARFEPRPLKRLGDNKRYFEKILVSGVYVTPEFIELTRRQYPDLVSVVETLPRASKATLDQIRTKVPKKLANYLPSEINSLGSKKGTMKSGKAKAKPSSSSSATQVETQVTATGQGPVPTGQGPVPTGLAQTEMPPHIAALPQGEEEKEAEFTPAPRGKPLDSQFSPVEKAVAMQESQELARKAKQLLDSAKAYVAMSPPLMTRATPTTTTTSAAAESGMTDSEYSVYNKIDDPARIRYIALINQIRDGGTIDGAERELRRDLVNGNITPRQFEAYHKALSKARGFYSTHQVVAYLESQDALADMLDARAKTFVDAETETDSRSASSSVPSAIERASNFSAGGSSGGGPGPIEFTPSEIWGDVSTDGSVLPEHWPGSGPGSGPGSSGSSVGGGSSLMHPSGSSGGSAGASAGASAGTSEVTSAIDTPYATSDSGSGIISGPGPGLETVVDTTTEPTSTTTGPDSGPTNQSQSETNSFAGPAPVRPPEEKVKYHNTAVKIFFDSDTLPQWDFDLEKVIRSLSISSEEIKSILDLVIGTYGSLFLVAKRKSEGDIQELVEVLELHFSANRLMAKGGRESRALMSISDLMKLTTGADTGADSTGTSPASPSDGSSAAAAIAPVSGPPDLGPFDAVSETSSAEAAAAVAPVASGAADSGGKTNIEAPLPPAEMKVVEAYEDRQYDRGHPIDSYTMRALRKQKVLEGFSLDVPIKHTLTDLNPKFFNAQGKEYSSLAMRIKEKKCRKVM